MSIRAGRLGGGRWLAPLGGGVPGAPQRPALGAPGGAWRASAGGCAPTSRTPWRPKKTWPGCGPTPEGRTPAAPGISGPEGGCAPRALCGNGEILDVDGPDRCEAPPSRLSSFIQVVLGRPNPPENADISSESSPSLPSPRLSLPSFPSLPSLPLLPSLPSWSLPSSNTSFLSFIVELVPLTSAGAIPARRQRTHIRPLPAASQPTIFL